MRCPGHNGRLRWEPLSPALGTPQPCAGNPSALHSEHSGRFGAVMV